MKRLPSILALLVLAGPAGAQITDRARLVAALDSAAEAHVEHPMVAGVSVAVVRGADTLLLRGYGLADLTWSVPTPADGGASYEIGSVTKQFTAAAVMRLVEEGRLDLDEDFTKYLPAFDTRGHAVQLRRLLDHTSGIKSYTEMPVFAELAVKDLRRDTLITLVEREPFDFEPGTAAIYNNSAYFLLGLIIEKVSGQSYDDYVREQLFEPAGMRDSYYCSESAIRENKATGFDGGPAGLMQKRPLSHVWPFAAGSLCSTAGDLVRWNHALHGGELLRPESYTAMITPMPLLDGTATEYAMGLAVTDRAGTRMIAHGGGINGYLSDAAYFPEEGLVIVVLQNSTGPRGPGALRNAIADLILGPVTPPEAVPFDGSLDALVGEYAGPVRGSHAHVTVDRDGDGLTFRMSGQNQALPARHIGDGVWMAPGMRVWFVVAGGRALELRVNQGAGHYVLRRIR